MSNVVSLAHRKEAKRAESVVTVERITENSRWDIKDGLKCGVGKRYCMSPAAFIIARVGAKQAWSSCKSCLRAFLEAVLERPADERERMEAKHIERVQYYTAERQAKEQHDAAGLCTGHSAKAPFGLCQRKALYETDRQHGTIERLCPRHVKRFQRWGWKMAEIIHNPRETSQ